MSILLGNRFYFDVLKVKLFADVLLFVPLKIFCMSLKLNKIYIFTHVSTALFVSASHLTGLDTVRPKGQLSGD